MRHAATLAVVFSVTAFAFAQQKAPDQPSSTHQDLSSLVYSEGGAFFIDPPHGWVIDREVGKQLGGCCVFYPQGSTWDNAETVMYPNIATKRQGQESLAEFMQSDLAEFRKQGPEVTYEDAEDVHLKSGRVARVRLFYGVNRGSSEAVAYIDEEKIIALVVLSSKTRKGLNQSMPLLRSALQTYTYMDIQKSGRAAAPQLPKD
jgi:hypothetical protein